MNFYSLSSLLVSVISIFFGNFVYYKDPKNKLNKTHMLLSILISYMTFNEFVYRQAGDYYTAFLWMKIASFWPLLISVLFHFVLIFTEKELKNKLIYIPIYFPALVFSILILTTDLIAKGPIKEYWGWTYHIVEGPARVLLVVWSAGMGFLSVYLCFRYYLKVTDPIKKQQAKYVTIGFFFPVVLSSTTEGLLPSFGIRSPDLFSLEFLFGIIVVGYAIWRYQLFSLSPATAGENIISTMSDALFLVSPDGTIQEVNQATLKLLGYEEEELIGQPFEIIVAEEEEKAGEELNRTGSIKDFEISLKTKNGIKVSVSLSVSVVRNKDGKQQGIVYIGRDLTERKRIEEELRRHRDHLKELVEERTAELRRINEQLQQEITERKQAEEEKEEIQAQLLHAQRMEAFGILAGEVAHDFNNLLTAIRGYSEVGLMGLPKGDSDYQDLFEEIHNISLRASDLTRQLLLFSRRQPVDSIPLDLNEVVSNLLKMLNRLVSENFSIISELTVALWTINADAGHIEQVIMNLVINARDAMPEGGEIIIRTENVYVDEDYCKTHSYARPGKFVCLSVKDVGVGMDSETMSRIFEPFFSTKGPGKGTGLGLSVAYGIIDQHEGWIDVESQLGHGSTFRIYLPAISPELEEEGRERFNQGVSRQGRENSSCRG